MTVPGPESRSVGQLVGEIGEDLSRLFRQEVELAKTEIRDEATKAGKAAGMFGGAGVAGWMSALFLSLAVVWALDSVMDAGWAALIVAVLWAIVGGVLFSAGKNKAREINPVPEQTVQTLKEDAQWARDLKN